MTNYAHGEQEGRAGAGRAGDGVDLAAACRAVRESEDPEATLRTLAMELGDHLVDLAIELSGDPRGEVRRAAAEFLGMGESNVAVTRLVRMLRDPDPDVRLRARSALADRGGQVAVDVLLETLEGEPTDLLPEALEILGTILEHQGPLYVSQQRVEVGDLVGALAGFLDHPVPDVRLEAARALTKGGVMAAPALAALAAHLTDSDYRVRANAIAAIAGIGSQEARLLLEEIALPRLRDDLASADPAQRAAAANAAGHVGSPALPVLVAALRTADDPLRFAIMLSLRRLEKEGHGVVRALLAFVKDDDPRMHRNVLLTLQDLSTPEALEVVRMARLDVAEDPVDRVLRLMETWARRERTVRYGPFRLFQGELQIPESEPLSRARDSREDSGDLGPLPAVGQDTTDEAFRRRVEEVLAHFGDRLSEHPHWDVVLERGSELEGLLLQPVFVGEVRADAQPAGSMEVVFERSTGELVLVIGGD